MRAVRVEAYGPPEVLTVAEVPEPKPGPGQVLVDVEVAGINFVDTMIRAGAGPFAGGPQPPFVLGNEIGGRVAGVGAGVDPALVGQLIVSGAGGHGGYAERAVAAVSEVNAVPAGLPIESAVALRASGRTAVALVRQARLAPGERVLVEAAAGGLGSLLVQLAKDAGAIVIGAANGARKLEAVRKLGADHAVDYTEPDWDARVRDATGGAGVDVVFESVGGAIGRTSFGLLAEGTGRFLIFGYASGTPVDISVNELFGRGLTVASHGGPQLRDQARIRALVAEALDLAVSGRLVPTIGQTYPLDQAAAAHAAIEARTALGKTLLIP